MPKTVFLYFSYDTLSSHYLWSQLVQKIQSLLFMIMCMCARERIMCERVCVLDIILCKCVWESVCMGVCERERERKSER
jgi:hypothetical protein